MSTDNGKDIAERIMNAYADRSPLSIRAGNSKAFYGYQCEGNDLDVSAHVGITNYDPRELVITARAGTTIKELEKALSENQQMFAFAPPRLNEKSTLGGSIASGLSGPRRPYTGSARDSVLGINCINGRGEQLSFGGQVIKNVAGYDVSRLMAGALGTLGVITEVSLKVIPLPAVEITMREECNVTQYLETSSLLNQQPLPISASCYYDNAMYLRLSGSKQAVNAASNKLAGDVLPGEQARDFWQQLRDYQHEFFATDEPLWRLSLPADTLELQLDGEILLDWGGAQRWIKTREPAETIRAICNTHGGHATLFKNSNNTAIFHPLEEGIARIHRSLKKAFDPTGILNPGRMYKDI